MLTRTVLSSAQSKSIPKIRDLGVMGLLLCLFPALLFGQATRKASGAKPTSPAGTMQHYNIKPSDLPAAKIENDVNNGPRVVPQPEGAKLNLPPGFEATVFAEGGHLGNLFNPTVQKSIIGALTGLKLSPPQSD